MTKSTLLRWHQGLLVLLASVAVNVYAQDNTTYSTIPSGSTDSSMSGGFDQGYDFVLEQPIPEVLSTTKLRQPKSRVPGTTTVIQGELIRDLGILNIWEVFRLVPGMTVGFVQSNRPVVSYHGTVADEQRRLQVQIDGRTAYQPNLADVDWHAMPVPLENIERIEVTRGPNAAAYGINAFLATINIITKSPQDTHGVNLRVRAGDHGYKQAYGSVGDQVGHYDWRLSYSRRESEGFDYRFYNPDDTSVKEGERKTFNDSYRFNTLNYDSILNIDPDNALDIRLGYSDVYDEEDAQQYGEEFGIQGIPAETGDDYYLQAKWTHTLSDRHFFHVQASYQDYNRRQRWRSCIPAGTNVGGTVLPLELCANSNQDIDENRLEFEIQDTFALNDNLRFVNGGGYREDRFDSDTYFNGEGSNYQTLLFSNIEYTPIHWVTFNAGASWEQTTALDDDFISPRFAINFQLTENQTLRFVFSKAVRTPDAFEQGADWGYRATDVTPEAAYGFLEGQRLLDFQAPGDLHEETIISREISYFIQHRMGMGLFSTEVKFFHDSLRDIISGVISADGSWDLCNCVALDQQGIEIESSLEYQQSQFRLTYAYMDQNSEYRGPPPPLGENQEKRYIRLQNRLTAENSGSFAWIQRFPRSVTTSAAYYIASDLGEYLYDRIDARVAKSFYLPHSTVELAAIMHYYPHDDPIMYPDNQYENQTQFFFEASVKF
ncbi:TonB-dependent receptor [Marinobacter sp. R17]|uniref:TonB-dependent receptor plug domain-containing protein n=1 Tax=Marinobacter sp. R17 TaxID=2484250 RepID=UPI000F4C6F7A|nr:TonB-dependent receptor [Marinobacter sp. R17]ROT99652.1 TonB-dependent receptor [Marinobacter sp. R17]